MKALLPSKRAFFITTALAVGFALTMAVFFPGCYQPSPEPGSFRCTFDQDYLCPTSLHCDQSIGLCVKYIVSTDMGPMPIMTDLGPQVVVPTCDDHVRKGNFANLTNLGAVNTATDETGFSVDNAKTRIYFNDSSGALRTAALTNAKSAAASELVVLTPAPVGMGKATFVGGDLWFPAQVTAADDMMTTSTSLFRATGSVAAFTVSAPHQPTAACPFDAPFFADGIATHDLYVSFPLAGCANQPLIAVGSADKDIGAFYAALPDRDLHNPTLVTGGTTLLFSSGNRLWFSDRPDTLSQFRSPYPLPLTALGAQSTRELEAQVSNDCKTLYLVLDRAGGHGGADLWAADIQ